MVFAFPRRRRGENKKKTYSKGGDVVNIMVGDVLVMKKQHPGCGSDRMKVLRVGADFKLTCEGCGRTFMTARSKCEKKIKSVIRDERES